MRVSDYVHDGIVLAELPFHRDHLRHDLKKAPGMSWHRDELPEGAGYILTLKAQDMTLSVRWVGAQGYYEKALLKKLLLRWYWERRGQWQEKDPGRHLPFPWEPRTVAQDVFAA